jgi:hypothetical protein
MPTRFACDLTAIPVAERAGHQEATHRLVSSAEIDEEVDGFGFQWSAGQYDAVAQFVSRERLCCPFLKFVIVVAAHRDNVQLHLSGPEGAKEFIRRELHLPGI